MLKKDLLINSKSNGTHFWRKRNLSKQVFFVIIKAEIIDKIYLKCYDISYVCYK